MYFKLYNTKQKNARKLEFCRKLFVAKLCKSLYDFIGLTEACKGGDVMLPQKYTEEKYILILLLKILSCVKIIYVCKVILQLLEYLK